MVLGEKKKKRTDQCEDFNRERQKSRNMMILPLVSKSIRAFERDPVSL